MSSAVAVIVPCYNGSATILACLRSLHAQRSRFSTELVVVDSSDDGTADLVSSAFPDVRVIRLDGRRSCGAARNIGLEATTSEIVLFIDADCVAPENWVDAMAGILADGPADAVCGTIANGTPWSSSGTVGYYLEFFRFLPHPGTAKPASWLVGGNSGFRRSALATTDFADASLGDDFLMSHRLRTEGARLMMLPAVSIRHLNRTGFATVWSYQRKLGSAAARYRRRTTQPLMRWLERFPVASLASPLLILPWVGSHVLWKSGPGAFLRYLILAPTCVAMSLAWTAGFYRGLRDAPAAEVAELQRSPER